MRKQRRRPGALDGSFAVILISSFQLSGCNAPAPGDAAEPEKPKSPLSSSHSNQNSSSSPSHAQSSGTTTPSSGLTEVADGSVRAALEVQAANVAQNPLATTVYYCSSADPLNIDTGNGSMTIATNDADPPGQSTGDSFALTYNQCKQGGQTLDGASTFTMVELTGQPYAPAPQVWRIAIEQKAEMAITLGSNSFATKTTFAFSAGTSNGVAYQRTISGASAFTSTTGGVTSANSGSFDNQYAWDVNANTYTQTVAVAHDTGAATHKLETLSAFAGTLSQTPMQGSARDTMTNGTTTSVTTITVLGNGKVRVETDADGDGVIDSVVDVPWWSNPLAGYFY